MSPRSTTAGEGGGVADPLLMDSLGDCTYRGDASVPSSCLTRESKTVTMCLLIALVNLDDSHKQSEHTASMMLAVLAVPASMKIILNKGITLDTFAR